MYGLALLLGEGLIWDKFLYTDTADVIHYRKHSCKEERRFGLGWGGR